MSRFAYVAVALTAVATALSIVPDARAASDLDGTWRAVRALGGDVQGSEITLKGTEVSGTGGCNRFSGSAVLGKGAIKFGALRATKMFCAGKMDTETIFLSALDATRHYEISGDELVFADETGSPVAVFTR